MVCGWEISYAMCSDSRDVEFLRNTSEEVKSLAEGMATELLDRWTGQVFGPCPVTVRPCRDTTARRSQTFAMPGRSRWEPVLIGGKWYNMSCGQCGSSCDCEGPGSIALPGPVHEVTEVIIDGLVLPEEAYRVHGRYLHRVDGGVWPTYQDRTLPDDAPGAFAVTYSRGLKVPDGGKIAAGVLALEIMRALCHDEECQLPQRVQTITRQGVTMAMLDGFEGLDEGKTGLWLVDSWITSVTQPRRGGIVRSPDYSGRR